jgi:hypothetical protein
MSCTHNNISSGKANLLIDLWFDENTMNTPQPLGCIPTSELYCAIEPSPFIKIPASMVCKDLQSFVNSIYIDLNANHAPPNPNYFLEQIILAPWNEDVHQLNEKILNLHLGNMQSYCSIDTFTQEHTAEQQLNTNTDSLNLPIEFLNSLNASGLPISEIKLKVGCPIILLQNLASADGLCNGSQVTIVQMTNCVLKICLIGGDCNGKKHFIPQIMISPSKNSFQFAFTLKQCQFPVQLAYVISINKAQG